MQHTIRSIFSWAKIGGDTPEPPPVEELSTTLFTDGTLIINEWKTKDREANIAKHGAVTNEYAPGPYEFEVQELPPWNSQIGSIVSVEFGSIYAPTSCFHLLSSMYNCTSINWHNFDASNVTNATSMFAGCRSLVSLDLSGFNTSNVTNMGSMFSGCLSLISVDLSSFDTSKVSYMSQMFCYCNNLETIYASQNLFDVSQVNDSSSMFFGCTSLIGGAGTKYDEQKTDKEYARVDNPPDEPGYFTAK